MELFNLSFLNSFCCNSLVHLMFDTKQKHWKQYTTDSNVIQSLVYVSLCFNFFRFHNLLDFDTAIMRFGFPYHAFTWQSLLLFHILLLFSFIQQQHFIFQPNLSPPKSSTAYLISQRDLTAAVVHSLVLRVIIFFPLIFFPYLQTYITKIIPYLSLSLSLQPSTSTALIFFSFFFFPSYTTIQSKLLLNFSFSFNIFSSF